MQFQSDILGVPVERPLTTETTAMAPLSWLACRRLWKDKAENRRQRSVERTFMRSCRRKTGKEYSGWKRA